jgi:hypothetical protein
MITLREQQSIFARRIAKLILWAYKTHGYEVTFGHAYRCEACKVGKKASYHKTRLAIDLNLFIDGRYCQSTEDHRIMGEKWESMGGTWGGRFKRPDGNHYSWGEV